jgi:hypothetical protein
MYELTAGEKLCLMLRSSAINCTIEFDTDNVRLEETYLGLSRSKILTIHNRSDYVVRFQWMRYEDEKTDIQRREKYDNCRSRIFPINLYNGELQRIYNGKYNKDISIVCYRYQKLFQLVHKKELVRYVNLVYYNICLPDIHELICQRIYADELALLKDESFYYNHMSFLLRPQVR